METTIRTPTPKTESDRFYLKIWDELREMKKSYYAIKYYLRNKSRSEIEHLILHKPQYLSCSRQSTLMYLYLTHPRIMEDMAWFVVNEIGHDAEDVDESYKTFLENEQRKAT